jgi:uncharacterized protein YndB with AHSA1/START domain
VFKIIAIVVVVVIAGVLILAATKPDVFRVQRSASIKTPPAKVFALINDFKRWEAWSPWEKKDPAMKRTYSAVTSGVGATYAWEGNKEVGQGGMEIIESAEPSKLGLKLDFLKPFEGHNKVTFTLTPNADATEVTWAMEGPVPFFGKVFHVFMDVDRMVGKDFEAGLAAMKAVAEK